MSMIHKVCVLSAPRLALMCGSARSMTETSIEISRVGRASTARLSHSCAPARGPAAPSKDSTQRLQELAGAMLAIGRIVQTVEECALLSVGQSSSGVGGLQLHGPKRN